MIDLVLNGGNLANLNDVSKKYNEKAQASCFYQNKEEASPDKQGKCILVQKAKRLSRTSDLSQPTRTSDLSIEKARALHNSGKKSQYYRDSGCGYRSPGLRSSGSRSPQRKSSGSRSPQRRSPRNRSPQWRSPGNRSPQRRSPENRSPENKSPGGSLGIKYHPRSTLVYSGTNEPKKPLDVICEVDIPEYEESGIGFPRYNSRNKEKDSRFKLVVNEKEKSQEHCHKSSS